MGENIKKSFGEIGKRFTFGGEPGKDQRVYFFNTKEIIGNKYGTPSPVPFRVVDNNIGFDVDIAIRCHGEYSYKIINPMLFYTNVCGNVEGLYLRETIDSQLKTELLTTLQPAFAKISDMGIRYSSLPAHTMEIGNTLNEVLSAKWRDLRGIEIVVFGVSSVNASEEDEKMIKEIQRNAAFRNLTMAAAHMVGAQAQAMQDAAKNEGGMGALGGFFGMNTAQNAGGMNAANLFCDGTATAGCTAAECTFGLGMLMRSERKYGEILSELRQTAACVRWLGVSVRDGKYRQVLPKLRKTAAVSSTGVQMRQMRLGAEGSGKPTEILP